ncbi:glutamyl-tRNA reductase [Falsarthrobacter nasiphocae]|uniref:Glutamyl-tRNA reductase n=1 Tax=Falsarthrobacter nasiphocae TaxID=189863 RepID=A0AAE3YFU5_9MICC|nr:glutamyl-tRNA reductase [Falsarthrobacter nasiphocae]MDR6891462.1 glutamyl-tRNA reductase [Falsarthrobacter nasiphocae]
MVYLSLVATHSDLDLERIARMSAAAPQVMSATNDSPLLRGLVLLSTCNRFEVYAEVPSAEDVEAARAEIVAAVAEGSSLSEAFVSASLSTLVGDDVPRHLFAVGAGLDSAVVGEREIAGQVRRALVLAQESSTASGQLTRLFQAATRTAKDVGSQTALGSQGKSIVSVGLDLVEESLDPSTPLAEGTAVIFGTGAYAGASMALLRERGVTDIRVFSQSGRAHEFTAARGGTPLTAETLPAALGEAQIILGCSGGDRRITGAELAAARTSADEFFVLDLALTHDFTPDVASIPGAEVLTLESIRLAAPAEAASALEDARLIVHSAAESFIAERTARQVDGAVVALRRHTMDVLERELEKVRVQHGCTAAGEEVEFALRRMVRQLLHLPTVRGRELAAQGRAGDYVAGLEALYGITAEVPEAPSASPADRAAPQPAGHPREAGESCPVPRTA